MENRQKNKQCCNDRKRMACETTMVLEIMNLFLKMCQKMICDFNFKTGTEEHNRNLINFNQC